MNSTDPKVQRRGLCLALFLAFVLLELLVNVADDQQADKSLLHTDNARTASTASHDKFGFYLMGDTPYRPWEASMLRQQIDALNASNQSHIEFMVHVGDFQKPETCDEQHYKDVADLLRIGDKPTVIVPGDNDWYDCEERAQSLGYWRKHMTALERDMQLRRGEAHPELFAFEKNSILFISIHLINGVDGDEPVESWNDRMQRNEQWIAEQLDHFSTSELRAVIILGHSLRSPRTRPFFEALASNFIGNVDREHLPVVYLHGDGHKWDVDNKFSRQLQWSQYLDVQIDQGAFADPCVVEIAKQVKGKPVPLEKEHDGQLIVANGLIRIDRQRGRYTNKSIKKFMKEYENGMKQMRKQKLQDKRNESKPP